jgi:hypothetical protein
MSARWPVALISAGVAFAGRPSTRNGFLLSIADRVISFAPTAGKRSKVMNVPFYIQKESV